MFEMTYRSYGFQVVILRYKTKYVYYNLLISDEIVCNSLHESLESINDYILELINL
jgi:hypothetical protein